MNRRSFLQRSTAVATAPALQVARGLDARDRTPGSAADVRSVSAGDLTPYTPRPEKPWNVARAAHLLRRMGYGFTWQELQAALATTPGAIVDLMLGMGADAPFTKPWVSETPSYPPSSQAQRNQYYDNARDMQEWWTGLMAQPALMFREKMVLFWHNHFVSEFIKVETPHLQHRQNQLFRQYAFGDFRELTKKVTVDAAMLIYLDGTASKAGNPNENYGRELMELFTLGAGAYSSGTPHYTEHDIVELARALTGWLVNPDGSVSFKQARFDSGNKTLLGATGNFGVGGHGDQDAIDLIFSLDDPDVGKKRAAVFICSKLYAHFVHDVPDMAIVAGMADTLVANNWSIGAVLRQLLVSEHFFDENVFGAKIKSPVDIVMGAIHQLGLAMPYDDPANPSYHSRAYTNATQPETHDPVTTMAYLSQTLLSPPNVKGWPGGHTWISSATVPLRIRYAQFWADPIGTSFKYAFDPVAFVKTLPDAKTDVNKMLDHLLEMMLPLTITSGMRAPLLDELLGGGQPYEWDPDAANAGPRIRACMVSIMSLAEYQLM